MNRYIDADELLELYDIDLDDLETDKQWTIPLEVVKQNIKDMPIADVEPVRHGRWKCKEVPCIYGKKFILTCSECGESVSVTESALPEEHYCRSCGAKMDGEEENK